MDSMKIIKYIEYFTNEKVEFYKWTKSYRTQEGNIIMANPCYHEGVEEFVDDFYESDLVDYNYLDNLNNNMDELSNPLELINSGNIDLLKSILTYYIRQEKFSTGMWIKAIEDKIFLIILERIFYLRFNEVWDRR